MQILIDDIYFYNFFSRSETANLFAVLLSLQMGNCDDSLTSETKQTFTIAMNDTGAEYDYTNVPPEDLWFGIIFLLLGIVFQSFAIIYERFNMDPMKRGLINQMTSNYMLWAMFQSIVTIIRWIIDFLKAAKKLPIWSMKGLAFIRWTSVIGALLAMLEVMSINYHSKMWLKRVPSYDHDFSSFWLQLCNAFVAFYYGALQTYSRLAWEEVHDTPKLM